MKHKDKFLNAPTLFNIYDDLLIESNAPTEPAPAKKQKATKPAKKKAEKDPMGKLREFDKKEIEDWGSCMSSEAKTFYRLFKNYIKRAFPDAEIIGFKPNHYNASGYIKQGNNYVYVSHSMKRVYYGHDYAIVDFSVKSAPHGVLFRIAKHEKDYTGDHNRFTSINSMVDDICALFKKMENSENAKNEVFEDLPLGKYLNTDKNIKAPDESNRIGKVIPFQKLQDYIGKKVLIEHQRQGYPERNSIIKDYQVVEITSYRKNADHSYIRNEETGEYEVGHTYDKVGIKNKKIHGLGSVAEIDCTNGRFEVYFPYPTCFYELVA